MNSEFSELKHAGAGNRMSKRIEMNVDIHNNVQPMSFLPDDGSFADAYAENGTGFDPGVEALKYAHPQAQQSFTFNTLQEGMGCGGETAAHCPKQSAYAAESTKQSAVNERPAADQKPICNAQNEHCTISSFPVDSTTNTKRPLTDENSVRIRVRRETPLEKKDARYYERCRRHNMIAKRSRDVRREQDRYNAERLSSLQREHDDLTENLKQVSAEKSDVQMRLDKVSSDFEALKRAVFIVHGPLN